jgi:hypothetical protein
MRKLRIVILSGLRIFPTQSGGHIRSGGVAKALSRSGHDVTVYSLAARHEDYGKKVRLLRQDIEPGLIELVHCGLAIGLLQTMNRRLGLPRLWQYFLLAKGLIPASLRNELEESDLIISDLPYCPPIKGFEKKPWILLSHNLEHRLLEQGSRRERAFAKWMERVESRAPQRYKVIISCAEEDRAYFSSAASAGGAQVLTVANGVDPLVYQRAALHRSPIRQQLSLTDEDWLIVFSGSRYQPNLEALEQLKTFCKREAHFLAQRRIHFLILGSMEASAYRQGALLATGPVSEVAPYFAAADAAINPVTRGSGSNVKVFEYLAAHLPILSSPFGLRGTRLQAHDDVLVFTMDDLRDRLVDMVETRSRSAWQAFAAELWMRQRSFCDMQELMRPALQVLEKLSLKSSPLPSPLILIEPDLT